MSLTIIVPSVLIMICNPIKCVLYPVYSKTFVCHCDQSVCLRQVVVCGISRTHLRCYTFLYRFICLIRTLTRRSIGEICSRKQNRPYICRTQWLRGRPPDSRLREPGFESCAAVLKPWASFFTLHCSSSLSCINEYLAIDSGGYVYAQPFAH